MKIRTFPDTASGATRPAPLLQILSLILSLLFGIATSASAAPAWSRVPLGGGGYVTGLFSDPTGNDIYCRSDLGGAFRWNAATGAWISLSDTIVASGTPGAASLMSVSSFAIDPSNANLIYMAVGRPDIDAPIRGMYASGNKGLSWTAITSPVAPNGLDGFRWFGERLAVDPNNSNVLWFGSAGSGLQKGTKAGGTWTWSQIPSTSVPFGQVASGADKGGVVFVACDKNTASTIVYAGVYDTVGTTGGIYVSTNGGTNWSKVSGPAIARPREGRLTANGTLYVTAGTTGVFKVPRGGSLSAVSPSGSYNFHSLTVDPSDLTGNTVYVGDTAEGRIWRSVNGGSNWAMQFRNFNNLIPNLPRTEPDGTPACGGYWFGNISSLLINPANPSELWAADFFGVARTQDAQNLGTTNGCFWYMLQKDQDETCVMSLKNAPTGPRLIAGLADVGGFRYSDTYLRPTGAGGASLGMPSGGNTVGLDFCEGNTNVWARTWLDNGYATGSGAVSNDGGVTWIPFGAIARKIVAASPAAGLETWDVSPYVTGQKAKGVNTITVVVMTDTISYPMNFDSKEGAVPPVLWINDTTPLAPIADAFVDGTATTTNYGASVLRIKNGYDDTNRDWSYLKFDLSGVSSISTAKLQLNRKAQTDTVTNFKVFIFACANTTWVEGNGGTDNSPANEIRWTNRPATRATSSVAGKMNPFEDPNYGGLKGGRIAVSATNPNAMVWLPEGTGSVPRYSNDRGASWASCTGAPGSQMVNQFAPSSCIQQLASDRVNGNFYLATFGESPANVHRIYRSTDGGANWAPVGSISGQYNVYRCQLVAAPNSPDELWLGDDAQGLWRSTNGGVNWTKIANYSITSVRNLSFGKSQTGSGYTVFINGIKDGAARIFRSDNSGSSWVSVGALPTIQVADALAGDRQVYGQFFLGTQGRGIYQYGAPVAPVAYSVAATPSSVATGGTITVDWTAPLTHDALDWVAVVAQGAPNTAVNDYQYVSPGTSGTLTLAAPSTAGTYEVRYLLNNGFTEPSPLARSAPITVTSFLIQDSCVRDGTYAATNQNGAVSGVVSVKNDAVSYKREGFFQFDFSSYTGTVSSATITLTPTAADTTGIQHQVSLVSNNAWTEDTITWNNKPASSTVLATYTITTGTPIVIPVTSQVAAAMGTGKKLSLRVVCTSAASSTNYADYASSENPDAALRPALNITP